MPISRNEKLVSRDELQAFFDDFERRSTVLEGGGLSFASFSDINDREDMLPDAFNIKPPMQRSAAIRLFSKALHKARRDGPLTTESLVARAEQIHRSERAISLKTYTLWTKIRVGGIDQVNGFRFRWNGVSIRTSSRLPKWLTLKTFYNSGVGEVDPSRPEGSGYIIVSCRERQIEDAVDRMLDALQLVLALMNIYEERGRWTLLSGRHWTAGKLRMGPFQFVFEDRVFLGESRIWYDPNYRDDSWNVGLPAFADYLKFVPFVRSALASLATHPLKTVLVTALQLMQDAFETFDGNHRLLRFWAALEKLYVEDWARERSNQKVIDRATFADEDPRLTRWHLGHIARVRNEHVHARGHQDTLEDVGQALRELLTRHILHWIFRGRDFPNHQALLDYVDLPRDNGKLLALKRSINRRLRMNDRRNKSE